MKASPPPLKSPSTFDNWEENHWCSLQETQFRRSAFCPAELSCMPSWIMVFRYFPRIAKFTSWYSQVFILCEVLPFLICSLVPRTYLTSEDPVSGWISLLSFFIASLLAMLPENMSGVISGQSILLVGSLFDEGFSKQPCFPPKAISLHTLYSGSARWYRT